MDGGRKSYFNSYKKNSNNDVGKEKNVNVEITELNIGEGSNIELNGGLKLSADENLKNDEQNNANDNSLANQNLETENDDNSNEQIPNEEDDSFSDSSENDNDDEMEDVSDDNDEELSDANDNDQSQETNEDKNEDDNQPDKKDEDKNEGDDQSDKKDEDKNKGDDQPDKKEEDKNKSDDQSDKKDEDLNKKPLENPEDKKNENQGEPGQEKKTDNDNKNQEDKSNNSKQDNPDNNQNNANQGEKKDDRKSPNQDKKNSQDNKQENSTQKDTNDKKSNANKNRGNKAEDIKKRAKDRLNPKNAAKNAFNKTGVGQKAQAAKDKYDKAKKAIDTGKNVAKGAVKVGKAAVKGVSAIIHFIVATAPVSVPILIVLFLAIVLIVIFKPNDDVNSGNGVSNYSKTDQKVLEKMRTYFNKYNKADGSLAMAVVLYPYFDVFYGGNVSNYLSKSTNENPEDVEDETVVDTEDNDEEDIQKEDGEKESEGDIYLEPFRSYWMRNKLKNVLKKLNNSTEDEFKEYLKNDYFKKDKGYLSYDGNGFNGYKKMLDSVPRSDREKLSNAMIEDIYSIKGLFTNYVFKQMVCSSSSTSLGYSDGTDLIKGAAVVVLKDTSSTNFSSIKSAESSYGTDDYHLDLKRYVMGVAYGEVGGWLDNEQFAKTAMIAAKSVVLGRNTKSAAGMGYKPDYDGDKTVFYMRNNSYDQVFCDIYEGCQSGSRYAHDLVKNDPNGETTGNVKPALSADRIALLEKWYDETAGKFVYDDESDGYYAAYLNDSYGTYCPRGACLLQTSAYKDAQNGTGYEAILKNYFSDNKYVIKDIETNTLSAVSVACSEVVNGGCTIPDNDFIYYSQLSYNDKFCGSDGTISSSGCGVTSMAMVIANLADSNVTPVESMNDAYQGGYCGSGIYGTDASYFKEAASKYGLTYDSIPSSNTSLDADKKIKDTLNSGGLIIANVAGSETSGTGKPWSTVSKGHYLVIKGISGDGKLIIADPMTTGLKNPWKNNLTLEEMRSYMYDKSFYLFTGGKSSEIKDKYCSSKGNGYLGNPLDPNNATEDFMSKGNAGCFPNYCGGSAHGAVDIPVGEGTPVYAMDAGIVEVSTYHYSWGNYVLINHQNGYKTLYAHFSKLGVSVGQNVTKGQLIGESGNTGHSTGPHLHIELQNTALYNQNGRSAAKSSNSKGLMNPAKYINSNVSYVGQSN